jgi:NADPH:quinone reductase-like Zn-dependent oxidoreductase
MSSNNNEAESTTGQRFVFNGVNAQPMFQMEERVGLPVLAEGEVLVRVRAATICMSDIHTVSGMRVEPTPRLVLHNNFHFIIFTLTQKCLIFFKSSLI